MSPVLKWKELSRKTVFEKYGRGIDEIDFQLPSGKIEKYFIKNEPKAVCILATTSHHEVVMIEQFRPGPNEVLLELPGGYVESSEQPEESIIRELLEETGYSGELEYVGACFDDAYSSLIRYCYVAKNCKQVNTHKNEDNTSVELVSLNEFRVLLKSGRMTDIEIGYLGLDYLNLL